MQTTRPRRLDLWQQVYPLNANQDQSRTLSMTNIVGIFHGFLDVLLCREAGSTSGSRICEDMIYFLRYIRKPIFSLFLIYFCKF